MKRPAGTTLSWQLLRSVLSIYFLITLLVTLSQMAIEYAHTRSMIRAELASVERTFHPALATALWELNAEQLDALLQGIIDLPTISSAHVLEPSGREWVRSSNDKPLGDNIAHRFRVSYHFQGEDIHLADISFEATGMVVLERLRLGYQMILMSALIKSTALTLLFLWAFRRQLGVPLRQFAHAVSTVDLDSLGRQRIDLGQRQANELSALQHAFNRMLDRLETERQAHQAALEASNAQLEALVVQRTEELAAANRHLEQLVRTDPLTGLANRRHFTEQAQREILQARRHARPLSVLMIDLDHFKQINDQHGHATGDAVLRNFALAVSDPLRASDLAARIGGEEFAVLLPDTGPEGAEQAARRILETVRAQHLPAEGAAIRYTVSIGTASLQARDDSYDSLLSRADHALYEAKAAGRDRLQGSMTA